MPCQARSVTVRGSRKEPSMSESDDVAELKARIAELEAEREREQTMALPTESRSHPRGLSVLSAVMIVVALVLAPLSVASVWANRVVSNTDQYVKTVEPL